MSISEFNRTPLCHSPGGTPPHWKIKPKIRPRWRKTPQISSPLGKMEYYYPHRKVLTWICRPHWIFWIENNENKYSSYKIKGIFYPHWDIYSKFYPRWLWNFHRASETGVYFGILSEFSYYLYLIDIYFLCVLSSTHVTFLRRLLDKTKSHQHVFEWNLINNHHLIDISFLYI